MRIVQLVPTIGPGSGVAGVAWNLDREFRAMGIETETFTYATALRGRKPHRIPNDRIGYAIGVTRRMLWFFTVGTRRAKEFLAERPDAVSICHNDLMAGDIYVNHGIVAAAMRARGRFLWRMVRNPTHLFTFFRDLYRYRSRTHRAVVALCETEVATLRRTFGRVTPPVTVIPNGVDLDRFHPPNPQEREAARSEFRLEDDDRVALFVGHEFGRKGLDLVIESLVHAPSVLLMVVGGTSTTIEETQRQADAIGVAERVLFVGPRRDVPHLMAASDFFVLPSYYESSGLVYLEALACGLPVVGTPVGVVPEAVDDGASGFVVPPEPEVIGDRMERLAAAELAGWRLRAREQAVGHDWRRTAELYAELAARLNS